MAPGSPPKSVPLRSVDIMRFGRRLLAPAVASILAVSALSLSLNSVSVAATGKTENLVLALAWSGPTNLIATMRAIVADYNRTHPGVHWTVVYNYSEEKLLSDIAANRAPAADMLITTQFVPTLAAKGAIQNLTPYIQKAHLQMSQFTPASLYSNSLLGVQYALPFFEDTYGLYYNKTLFAQAGIKAPPTTLQQLAADAKLLTKVGANGQYTQLGFNPSIMPYFLEAYLYGGRYATPSGTVTADSPGVVKGNAWLASIWKQYDPTKVSKFLSSNAGAAASLDPFTAGKVGMDISGEWYMPTIAQEAPHLDYGVAPIPYPAGMSQYAGAGSVGGNPMVIPENSPAPAQAWDLIEWLSTTGERIGTQAQYFPSISAVPALKALVNSPAAQKIAGPKMAFFWKYSASKNVIPFPPVPDESTYTAALSEQVQDALLGTESMQAALEKVQAQVAPIVAADLAAWKATRGQ